MTDGLIGDDEMGDVWPAVHPGSAAADYGTAGIAPTGPFEVRSFQTLTLTYTVGRFGLDDSGCIKIVQRFPNDGGRLQVADPAAMNYVTARASNGCGLVVTPEPDGHQRPWERSLRITVRGGSMHPGDTIEVTFGDRAGGSPGLRLQTFCETAHEFRVLADPCATGHFFPLPDRPHVAIVAGAPLRWRAVLPTHGRPGEAFALGLRADDLWGNPSHRAGRRLLLVADAPVRGLPAEVEFPEGERALRIAGLTAEEGIARVRVLDADGGELACSNPLVLREGQGGGWWGDLHGQSGETVGVNTIDEYFAFGRDLAFLDVMSHQANDFQVTGAFWKRINEVTERLNRDGRFVAFPGYEWSGNTPVGGDHNVFFRHAGRPIRRSSHALLEDRSDLGLDANTTTELFAALADEDCVVYAHVGGRPADIGRDDGGRLRTAVEVHSDWGSFEWIMRDAFARGYRLGLVCNSDGHKGRPGASHPGASQFGAFGGLTCFLADELSRDGIFSALRRRHHYGTTGCRMYLDMRAEFPGGARIFATDPRLGPAESRPATGAVMGDIAATADARVRLRVEVAAHAPVLRVDVLNGPDEVATARGYGAAELGDRIRVTFHGAEYRGRGRQTAWKGHASFSEARIGRFERINAWNHDRLLQAAGPQRVDFDVLTTGNFTGFDAWLADSRRGTLEIDAGHAGATLPLADLGLEPVVLDAGGLERQVRIARLPDACREDHLALEFEVDLKPGRDNPLWVRVTTEDGYNAWSSPIYVVPEGGSRCDPTHPASDADGDYGGRLRTTRSSPCAIQATSRLLHHSLGHDRSRSGPAHRDAAAFVLRAGCNLCGRVRMGEATTAYRCPVCGLDGRVALENDHCLFLQEPQQVLVGAGIIVPREHRPTLFDLTEVEWDATYSLLQRARALLNAAHRPDGYNVGWNAGSAAGQEIPHSHLHVIPRFANEPLAGKGIRYWLKQPGNKRPG